MSNFRLIVATLLLAACHESRVKPWSIAVANPETLRQTSQGAVVGGDGRYGNHAWLGIPFAAPPVGDLRWRAPHPATPWKETLQALTPASPCPQFSSPMAGVPGREGEIVGSEDCLYLNVSAPKFTPDKVPAGNARLPVMFWIHGGGNSIGTSSFYDGGHLSAQENVIVVTTQYRLGPLGWFRNAAFRSETSDPAEQSGNFGTLDQIQALHWVHDNIAAFGGDPDNVTIFGESAGGQDVYTMLLSPLAKGLFHRAIVESGGLSETTVDDAENRVTDAKPGHRNSSGEVIERLLEQEHVLTKAPLADQLGPTVGNPPSLQVHPPTAEMIRDHLRGKSPAEILSLYRNDLRVGMIDMPLVFHDGTVLPKGDWTEALADPQGWNRVPVIAGTNHDEFKLFLAFNPKMVWRLFGIFPRIRNVPLYEAVAEYVTRSWKANGVDRPVAAMRRSGENDVYAYRFDWHDEPTVAGSDLSRIIGAAHGIEIPFVFDHFDLGRLGKALFDEKSAPEREQLAAAMMSYWTQFARTGSPGRGRNGELVAWTPWDSSSPDAPKYIVLDSRSEGGIRMASEVQSRERILADIDGDTRLSTQREKCAVFGLLTGFTHGLSKMDYPHVGRVGCADYPLSEIR